MAHGHTKPHEGTPSHARRPYSVTLCLILALLSTPDMMTNASPTREILDLHRIMEPPCGPGFFINDYDVCQACDGVHGFSDAAGLSECKSCGPPCRSPFAFEDVPCTLTSGPRVCVDAAAREQKSGEQGLVQGSGGTTATSRAGTRVWTVSRPPKAELVLLGVAFVSIALVAVMSATNGLGQGKHDDGNSKSNVDDSDVDVTKSRTGHESGVDPNGEVLPDHGRDRQGIFSNAAAMVSTGATDDDEPPPPLPNQKDHHWVDFDDCTAEQRHRNEKFMVKRKVWEKDMMWLLDAPPPPSTCQYAKVYFKGLHWGIVYHLNTTHVRETDVCVYACDVSATGMPVMYKLAIAAYSFVEPFPVELCTWTDEREAMSHRDGVMQPLDDIEYDCDLMWKAQTEMWRRWTPKTWSSSNNCRHWTTEQVNLYNYFKAHPQEILSPSSRLLRDPNVHADALTVPY